MDAGLEFPTCWLFDFGWGTASVRGMWQTGEDFRARIPSPAGDVAQHFIVLSLHFLLDEMGLIW